MHDLETELKNSLNMKDGKLKHVKRKSNKERQFILFFKGEVLFKQIDIFRTFLFPSYNHEEL